MKAEIRIGHDDGQPYLRLDILGYLHPDVAEPEGLDLLRVRAHASAAPLETTFDLTVGVYELRDLREYLEEINSGNGPMRNFAIDGGLLTLSFAPSRRGPVLCAVLLKSIDASHLRVEYLVTLEPESITRTVGQLSMIEAESL
jgi:hypothetical protein